MTVVAATRWRGSLLAAVAPALAGVGWWIVGRPGLATACWVLAGVLGVLALLQPARAGRLVSTVGSVGQWVGQTLGAVAMVVLYLATVIPLWVLDRLLGSKRAGSTPGWRDHQRASRDAGPFSIDEPEPRRWRRPLGVAVLIVLLAGGNLLLVDRPLEPEIVELGYWPPAFVGQPGAHDLFDAQAGYRLDPDALTLFRAVDHEGAFEVRDGIRTSYRTEDPALTVWFFGGSTTFGIGQRDEHTIPSNVVRLAEQAGYRIQAFNFGVSSWSTWQEAIEFSRRLGRLPRPDLVVFYDGVNDYAVLDQIIDHGWRSDEPWAIGGPDGTPGATPGSAKVMGSSARATVRREYAQTISRARRQVLALADEQQIPVRFFWQPTAISKAFRPSDGALLERLNVDPAGLPDRRSDYRSLGEEVDPPAIDVSDALDGFRSPIYFDWAHTNERGARVVAAALWVHLEPVVAELGEQAATPSADNRAEN